MYTVGEFSKICQVSVKTLHYYDRIGLLPPLTVDAETGYRYYGIEQVNQMLLISRLKRYGLSLEDIRTFLSPESDYAQLSLLKKHHQQLKTQQYVLTQIISELEGHLYSFERTGNLMDYQNRYTITLTTAPSHPVLTSRKTMAINDFGTHYSALYERMAKKRLTPNGMRGAIYHDDTFNESSTDVELFVGIQETDQADDVIGGMQWAMTIHKGGYSSLSDAYGALVAWIEEHGYAWAGAPFECYTKTQFDGLAPEDWETEIYFPIQDNN